MFAIIVAGIAIVSFFAWTSDTATWGDIFNIAVRSSVVAAVAYFILRRYVSDPRQLTVQLSLVALIVFELFSVNMDHPDVYDSLPHSEQLSMAPPPLVQRILDDDSDLPFRVDGFRGIEDNYGSLYGVMDMRGISPLFLKGPLVT